MVELKDLVVLLVDDDREIGNVLQRWAKWVGPRLDVATNGAEGLALARVHEYDAILFDLRMPVMDGPAFFQALKEERPLLARRAVALTGDVSSHAAQRFLAQARCRWLLKPFDLQEVAAMIGRACVLV